LGAKAREEAVKEIGETTESAVPVSFLVNVTFEFITKFIDFFLSQVQSRYKLVCDLNGWSRIVQQVFEVQILAIDIDPRVHTFFRGYQHSRDLRGMSDLDEGVSMFSFTFAPLTKIKIVANDAFVSKSNDWADSTTIACDILMNNLTGFI